MYLTYLYTLGSIGLLLFLAVFTRILVIVRRSLDGASGEERALLFGLVFGLCGFLIAIFFSEYTASAYLLWAYLGAGSRIALQSLPGEVRARTGTRAPDSKRESVPLGRQFPEGRSS
jgi:hypothetical protein